MQWSQSAAETFVPDAVPLADALARTTRLAIASHQDDLELMTWHGIASCLGRRDEWFTGVVVTDGARSPRGGRYAHCTDDEMRAVRSAEQKRAAILGEYGALIQLGLASDAARAGEASPLPGDLDRILESMRPRVVYTHSLFDRHDTHVAVAIAVIAALRRLAPDRRPEAVHGCEVWRGLDWLEDEDRVGFDVGGHDDLHLALIGVHDSQIGGGKRYDRAALGRRRANATFGQMRAVDRTDAVEYAMNLTPLLEDVDLDVVDFAVAVVRRSSDAIATQLRRLGA